jgi:hypothetical protein
MVFKSIILIMLSPITLSQFSRSRPAQRPTASTSTTTKSSFDLFDDLTKDQKPLTNEDLENFDNSEPAVGNSLDENNEINSDDQLLDVRSKICFNDNKNFPTIIKAAKTLLNQMGFRRCENTSFKKICCYEN